MNSTELLNWYDLHARELPWRVSPAARAAGQLPDPYRIWLSEIMLQQTTVAVVKAYFLKFTAAWPTVVDLAAAEDADVMAAWAGLGYYARARNLLKCARVIVAEHGGQFPADRAALQNLPGIGPYTSAAIAAIAFDHAETVVDGNVERVMARLFDLHAPLPQAKGALTSYAASLTPPARPGDYAQAVMDLGATICTPKSPRCALCPWHDICAARKAGTAAELPKKLPKVKKPTRFGTAYVARRSDGAVLLEQRPERGLLGGMLGWPGSEWRETLPDAIPPIQADWIEAPGEVRHTFTHFHLRLRVMVAQVDAQQTNQTFTAAENFRPADLPTVMRKIWSMAEAKI
ncbi:A/G-specific adenine glycosylase [Planktomarina temperata]|jgi:A/G-specific adenine glycosylase|uniref:A/G-specific adenine glycosylase n=1 Tax=Planktomarina temperata TaxID=1284658 RepID=UPI0023B6271F